MSGKDVKHLETILPALFSVINSTEVSFLYNIIHSPCLNICLVLSCTAKQLPRLILGVALFQ